jgi:tetratricopeptide (TPR) repeat protein
MSDSSKAVFLSYASQDADAARRICDALRAADVEVWFDQSELVGGDTWDAKIRGQIALCALFVPVISANTQARREGYFRIEWRLAAQRTHAMSDDTTFLLPVVIDDTRDAEAKVPVEFKAVQWTRLRPAMRDYGGQARDDASVVAFCARVKKLLEAEMAGSAAVAMPALHVESRRARSSSRRWIVLSVLGIVAVVAVVVWRPWSKPAASAGSLNRNVAGESASPQAALLLARARELMDTPTRARLELETADQLCRQAVAIDALSAAAWALWSRVDSWLVYFNYDNSIQRRESARAKAEKAMRLAPAAFESKLAQASYVVLANQHHGVVSALSGSVRELFRGLHRERPTDPDVLLTFALLERNLGEREITRKLFGELASVPRYAGVAHTELGWAEQLFGEPTRADAAAEKAVAAEAYWNSLILKADMASWWWGDLPRAQAAIDQMPVSVLGEDGGISQAVWLAQSSRDFPRMLDLLASVPREWLQSNFFEGPTGYLTAVAHEAAGRPEAARQAAERARQVVEARLVEAPGSPELLIWKARLQAILGESDAAKKTFLLFAQLNGGRSMRGERGYERAGDHWLLGDKDTALAFLEDLVRRKNVTWGNLATAAELEPMRGHPRFQALLAVAKADPKLSPHAHPPREPGNSAATGTSAAPEKSAVK